MPPSEVSEGVDDKGIELQVGIGVKRSGSEAGIGCMACVVVLRAGANASFGTALGLKGCIPVALHVLLIISDVNAFFHAWE